MRRAGWISFLLATTMMTSLPAQEPLRVGQGVGLGVSVGTLSATSGGSVLSLQGHLTHFPRRTIGADLAIGVLPAFLDDGEVAILADFGVAGVGRWKGATTLVRTGVGGIAAFGSGGAAALPGAYMGGFLLLHGAGRVGVRLDVTGRLLVGGGAYLVPVISVGIGLMRLPQP